MMVPVACAADSSTEAATLTPVTPEVTLPVSSAEVGSAACCAMTAATCAGVDVTIELGSGRMTKTTTTDPGRMAVMLTRNSGTPAALAMSPLKLVSNWALAGLPSGISSMFLATVSSTSAGGSNSLSLLSSPSDVVEFCCPPDQGVPTPMMMFPSSCWPVLGWRWQRADVSETSCRGLQGFSPLEVIRAPMTSVLLFPKDVPVTVMITAVPAVTWTGSMSLTVGAGKDT
mmetsp:Transcript_32379/g.82566  ORF Transcript_32379/g.82566 Transcript_32379/m.82566 type:complete len:229 (+) Transcript_32379:341-1027(+)